MKRNTVGRAILMAGGVACVCLACTNPYYDNVVKIVDQAKNGPAATPVFSPAPGSYSTDQLVTISSATAGAVILYTTDGSTPTASSPVYAGPVLVAGPVTSKTIRAFARKWDFQDSVVASATYSVNWNQVSTPTFSPMAGTYSLDQSITISCATAGAAIHYTTDGSTPTAGSPLYTAAVLVAGNGISKTINAMATKSSMIDSSVGSAAYTINYSQVSTPNFFPGSGTFAGPTPVVISSATPGASIRYTTDGTTPTSTTGNLYSGSVNVNGSMTLKAIAYEAGWTDSTVSSAVYTLPAAAPTFSPVAGTYPGSLTVAISSTTPGASIHYTTDGSTPTSTTGIPYSGPVAVNGSVTLLAIAFAAGWSDSPVSIALYTLPVSPPMFSPVPGAYAGPQGVTIFTSTPGATIRYTTDGSTPTSSTGTVYSVPVNVNTSMTLRAIAYEAGWSDSPVAVAPYSIAVAVPTIAPFGGRIGHTTKVTLSCATPGATIVYTLDGSFPTETGGVIGNGTSYTVSGPFVLPYGNTTVTAMAFRVGMTDSPQVVASFTEPVFVYASSATTNNVLAQQVNLTDGSLSLVGNYGLGAAVETVAADPAGRYLFASTDLLPSTNAFAINSSSGTLAQVNGVAMGNQFLSAAVDNTGQYLYVSTGVTNGVTGYSINQTTGAVSQTAIFSALGNTAGVAADPVAPYLYVALSSTGQVQAYSIMPTGQLNSIGTYTSALGTYSVVVHPTGKYLYAGNQSGGYVTAFTINTSTGALTPNGSMQSAGAPIAVTVDPTGRFLYSADYSGARIYAFAINNSNGMLSPVAGSPFGDLGGTSPVSLTVEPSGKFLYVAHAGTPTLSIFHIDSVTGALSFSGSFAVGGTQTCVTSTGIAQ